MKPDKTLRNVLVGIGYLATMFVWLPLLPFIAAVFVWRNWFGWAAALNRLPGVAGGGGARSGLVVFLYAFVLLALLGTVFGSAAPGDGVPTSAEPVEQNGDARTPTPQNEPNLVTKPSAEMLPTLDDFDAGWMENPQDRTNETAFYNVETDTLVFFRVTKFESVAAAETGYTARQRDVRQDGLSTEAVEVGDEGFLYKYDRAYVVVTFRVKNVVGQVDFDGPRVAAPESDSVRFAQLLEDKITN